ncbi:MAG: hypothetical protein OEW39_11890 [Deltaproteobacteria bacterium]|nr:hypothetical protein [Deltaproteobacteria bacterium]
MALNIRPHSERGPLLVDEEDYEQLARRSAQGWSECADEREWLVKLHYLRAGFKAGKLDSATFEERELRLVQAWLAKLM